MILDIFFLLIQNLMVSCKLEDRIHGKKTTKPIENKITEKVKIIKALNIRIEKSNELKALLNEQKLKEVKTLHEFIKTFHLGLNEAIKALQQYLSNKYGAIA
ncbi:MAG: hypothetical protein HFI47_12595 [Lachnospiraceae bacterium]|nr:hypothetical protein [Lachnospiraceae bacterium]